MEKIIINENKMNYINFKRNNNKITKEKLINLLLLISLIILCFFIISILFIAKCNLKLSRILNIISKDLINDNSLYKSKKIKNNKIVAISYSNQVYLTQLEYNRKSAIEIGKVDEFYSYGPENIDKIFKENNKDILSRNKGNGYWLWKSYFLLKTMKEKLNEGDYLIYTDACNLYMDNTKILIEFMIKEKAEILLYRLPFLEKCWTKRDAFILMGADSPFYSDTNQFSASHQIYRKSKFTEIFLEELLYYSQDKRIITDEPNTLGFPNLEGFLENRHDQSVLSLLIKKYGLAYSGKANMNITKLNNFDIQIPFIFCHYRRMYFKDYNDLMQKCGLKTFK